MLLSPALNGRDETPAAKPAPMAGKSALRIISSSDPAAPKLATIARAATENPVPIAVAELTAVGTPLIAPRAIA